VDTTNSKGVSHTVRGIFIIDPNKEIRLIFSYPTSIGANTAEVLRVVDALQTSDASK
jgi:alkyl hydroperoxide reductase subunit AhpC